jgi:hypothetical protein
LPHEDNALQLAFLLELTSVERRRIELPTSRVRFSRYDPPRSNETTVTATSYAILLSFASASAGFRSLAKNCGISAVLTTAMVDARKFCGRLRRVPSGTAVECFALSPEAHFQDEASTAIIGTIATRTAAALLLLLGYVDSFWLSLRTVRHFDLGFLTHKQAWELQGQRIVCRVDLDSRPEERGGYTVYDCASPDDTYRTVWLREGEQVEGTMIVEAILRLRYVPPGQGFDGFWEYRLVDAVRK